MAQYTYKVELETNTGFILDTDVLDTGVLGYLLQDVTQYVRSVSTRRGKSTLQGKFTAGQMTVVFDNRTRAFDPKYTSSPYNGSIVPRRRIIFSMSDARFSTPFYRPLFTGWIDDWNLSYDISGDSTSTAQCSDAFTILANQNIVLTNPPTELSSNRFNRVLTNSSVAWPLELTFSSGTFTLGTASYSGNALDYLQNIADSETGYFYVNTNGYLVLRDWNSLVVGTAVPSIKFSTTGGTALPITEIAVQYGTEELVNYVTVTSAAGTVTVQDTTSQQTYGITAENYATLLNAAGDLTTVGNFYITNYSQPRYRISQLKLSLDDPSVKDFYLSVKSQGIDGVINNISIGSYVQVDFIPNNLGSAITQKSFVIGHDIDATPESCTFTYSIAGEDTRSYV